MAAKRDDADESFDSFLEKNLAKYPAASQWLSRDGGVVLTYDRVLTDQWRLLRNANPIELTFATIRLPHRRTQGQRQAGS